MRNYTFLSMFRKYVNSSLILIIVTIVAMIVANSGWGRRLPFLVGEAGQFLYR